ncbi:hypothetical protein G3N56_02830 [Desulfovibrio sulfodismutans]|uniref:Uncharacterized protein n=1 Tax=Desulfolutivibrio sulfodismutans TaxID=63561 RepID=A0A7K3NHJ6_9BACT|nr:hypothetical protein [Desulfolutivibrio sulfodismutans]NDY55676.1 hypothetical protein [Desulfolutivibrio sulfodismutans]QLA13702.1 hypothetical protein GD606_16260 [Desulfolutivibrio sulfodismutans DSM 3696]
MKTVTTRFGTFGVQDMVECYPYGALRAVIPAKGTVITTGHGAFIPRSEATDERTKTGASLEFYPDGALRSIILQNRTPIATPAGEVLAEQILFYPDGAVKRVFPLCGRTSAYWSQEDEAGLLMPFAVATPLCGVTAKFLSLAFDDRGRMRSFTLFPGQIVDMDTPAGPVPVRIGAAFHPDGALRSVEPGRPTPVPTPAGMVLAFDPDATGITGDVNSLEFDPSGRLKHVAMVRTKLTVRDQAGNEQEIMPAIRESLCGNSETEPVAMTMAVEAGRLVVRRSPKEPAITVVGAQSGDFPARAAILPPAGLFAAMQQSACHGAPVSF